MRCKIEYCGKWDGKDQYYCSVHRSRATDKDGNVLEECISTKKNNFANGLTINAEDITSMEFIYPNLLASVESELKVNDEGTSGIMYIGDSIFELRDFGGLLLAKLNCIELKVEHCTYCGHVHSDDGRFAYMPHNPHLCAYCGHMFNVTEANVGNELAVLFDIPEIELEKKEIEIQDQLTLTYDVLKGNVLINGVNADTLIIDGETISLVDYLNKRLYNEY